MSGIGGRIRKERLKRNLKQCELAAKAKISNSYLSDIEVGRTDPSLKTLERIAKALEMDVRELL